MFLSRVSEFSFSPRKHMWKSLLCNENKNSKLDPISGGSRKKLYEYLMVEHDVCNIFLLLENGGNFCNGR